MAREPQSAKRNFESGLRGGQDSPPAERRGIDGQKQRATSCLCKTQKKFESSSNKNWLSGGDRLRRGWLGWTRDGSAEEIAGWMMEAQRLNREAGSKEEKTPRGGRERIWERCQNGRRLHGWSGWFSVVVRVQSRILQAISEWKRPVEGKEFGSVGCCDRGGVSESVELERRWSVGGLHRHFPCRKSLTLQECFRKLDGVNVGTHELFTPPRTLGRIAMPRSHRQSEMERTIKDCWGAARWTAVELGGQLTFISAHLPHKGKKLGEFEAVLMEIQEFVSGRPKQHVILGGGFNASLYGMTD